ncbi:hypothetical protein CLPU_11c01080 [Gottschalkia purinilytica]|uniref:DUF1893 domain-containing protein n=1 Tax=Gottschalkia purinilytica TaxID=1503 RepID=A0A0L0W8R9_GOTPU|nr:DUF1893 domain-containing protein [Gottschalkia purinilytica]KNF07939.1 hypothetical protein CLPU_11c01080 [Gottschalkia purinilytica]
MKDIELAKDTLEKENLSLVIVKDGKILFRSADKGIKPIYNAVLQSEKNFKGSSIADKVTGKAAALLCKCLDIKRLFTEIISEGAINVLENSHIIFTYDKAIPYIKNRDMTDVCPIEKIAQYIDEPEVLISKISEFLENIRKSS